MKTAATTCGTIIMASWCGVRIASGADTQLHITNIGAKANRYLQNIIAVRGSGKTADLIDRGKLVDYIMESYPEWCIKPIRPIFDFITGMPSSDVQSVVRCKDCKYWRRQTNYTGAQLSFGFCESDDMWRSLYGETYEVSHIDTDDDFYCGYAERRQDG